MKRARVAYAGAIHDATEDRGRVRLTDGRVVKEDAVVWLPPVEPGTIFAAGLNYSGKTLAEPLIFLNGPGTLCGHRGQTQRAKGVKNMHYQCELVVLIGATARGVARKDAYRYVAGYTVANDYTIRDSQDHYRDFSTPLGPWLVDAADIPDPMNLRLTTRVNGKVTEKGNTRDMIFDIPALIEYLSSFMTLEPGDLILTGTPEGLANVQVGDEVVTEIEGIGRLKNTIV